MENLLSFPALFTTLFVILVTINLWIKLKSKTPNLPPGPSKLPIIGNIHQLAGSLPHRKLRDLATKHGSVIHLQLGELSTVVVSSPEAAKVVMKTHDAVFAQRPINLAASITTYNYKDIAFSNSSYWRQLRKICILELLSAKRVQSYRSIREEEVSNLIRTVSSSSGKVFNLSRSLFSLTYGVVSRASFGKKSEDQDRFLAIAQKMSEAAGGFGLADLYPSIKLLFVMSGTRSKLLKLHKEADTILENIINDRRIRKKELKQGGESEEENLLDVLLRLQERGNLEFPLTEDNIKAVILCYLLHRGILIVRVLSHGYEIPAKTKVTVNAWAIGRDPNHWEEAENFKPERFAESGIDYKGNNFELIPFGAGRRMCPGITFGIANVELPLAQLLFHFDWNLLEGMKPEDFDMEETFGASVGRKNDLELIPIRHCG